MTRQTNDKPEVSDVAVTSGTDYPLSERAFRWICKFNGTDSSTAPDAWRYAPNAIVQEDLDRYARDAAFADGLIEIYLKPEGRPKKIR